MAATALETLLNILNGVFSLKEEQTLHFSAALRYVKLFIALIGSKSVQLQPSHFGLQPLIMPPGNQK